MATLKARTANDFQPILSFFLYKSICNRRLNGQFEPPYFKIIQYYFDMKNDRMNQLRGFVLFFIVALLLTPRIAAQNPESGSFWSVEKNENKLVRDGDSVKYEGMGWSETPSGKYAFEFSEKTILFHENGFMGENYIGTRTYNVSSRKMLGAEDDFTVYEYLADYAGEKDRWIVKVLNKDEYKEAFIFLYENPNKAGYYDNKTIYSCVRQYR